VSVDVVTPDAPAPAAAGANTIRAPEANAAAIPVPTTALDRTDFLNMIAGIIDWGVVCLSAAGIDLSLYWSLLPSTARAAFRSAYGEISEENLIRARVRALSLSALLALYGRDQNMRGVEREALHRIERTLID
jgi:hypothetical protein